MRLFGAVRKASQSSIAIAVAVHRLPNGGGVSRLSRSRTQATLTRLFAERMVGDPTALRVCGAFVVDNRLLHSVSDVVLLLIPDGNWTTLGKRVRQSFLCKHLLR